MSDTPERHPDADADRRFAERLAAHYRPQPLDPAARTRFDATLRERLERRPGLPAWLPVLASAAAALVLFWWAWPAATPTNDAPESLPRVAVQVQAPTAPATQTPDAAASPALQDWSADVLLADATDTGTPSEESYLPDEYVALAVAFIDGQ